jgi:hypothetical protein
MSFDIQKLFIGPMEFFSVVLPGALLILLLMEEVGPPCQSRRHGRLGRMALAVIRTVNSLLFTGPGHTRFLRIEDE